jgi:hypothetical protein
MVSSERAARTSRYRGEKAVPFSLKGMGITPIVERSVVSGIDVPLLSFPRFHGFRQTNRTSWFAIGQSDTHEYTEAAEVMAGEYLEQIF